MKIRGNGADIRDYHDYNDDYSENIDDKLFEADNNRNQHYHHEHYYHVTDPLAPAESLVADRTSDEARRLKDETRWLKNHYDDKLHGIDDKLHDADGPQQTPQPHNTTCTRQPAQKTASSKTSGRRKHRTHRRERRYETPALTTEAGDAHTR